MNVTPEDIQNQINESLATYFSADSDPEQIPPGPEISKKYYSLHPHVLEYEATPEGKLIGWVSGFPTRKELMNKFLSKEINERQLFEQTEKMNVPEVVYINVILVFPEFRGQGVAHRLVKKFVTNFLNENPHCQFFAWQFSTEGGLLMDALENEADAAGIKILRRK